MQIGIQVPYNGRFADAVDEVVELESVGLDIAFVAEAYSFDAVSQLGYLAARTTRVQIASGILPIYSRTPALIAMTAAGLDHVSDGRFMLGLGASGPQVVEGLHGVVYDAPVARTREIVEICRKVWRREPLAYEGAHYTVPLPADRGTGLGKPLKLINHPQRADIPVLIAGTGPKNVELAAELAQAWEPIFFHPERAEMVWGDSLAVGKARRAAELGDLQIIINAPVAIGDNADELLDRARPQLALYIGGMGARGRNFYNDLACRYGYEAAAAEIQDLYLAGMKREAEAAVPDELVRATTLIGPAGYIKERLAAYAEAGVTTINVQSVNDTREARRASVEALLALAS
jgi:F420-dependent oxidoreductase-like protein